MLLWKASKLLFQRIDVSTPHTARLGGSTMVAYSEASGLWYRLFDMCTVYCPKRGSPAVHALLSSSGLGVPLLLSLLLLLLLLRVTLLLLLLLLLWVATVVLLLMRLLLLRIALLLLLWVWLLALRVATVL